MSDRRARAHLVEVLLEAPLPVAVRLEAAVLEDLEDDAHVLPPGQGPEPDPVGVAHRHHDPRVVGEEPDLVAGMSAAVEERILDGLDDSHTVVRVDELIADVENHRIRLLRYRIC